MCLKSDTSMMSNDVHTYPMRKRILNKVEATQGVLDEVVLPPKYKRMPEKSQKGRKESASEKISTITNHCGCCCHEEQNRGHVISILKRNDT